VQDASQLPPVPPSPLGAEAPLAGIRVVELGQLLAGPFAATLLAYFGADVVKVEPPGKGDPIRGWRVLDPAGTSYWWRSLGRNKRCVTADLRHPDGQALVRRLLAGADVVIENFRPGTLEGWGLDLEAMRVEHPRLILARVSGFGQSGPYAHRPGYASVCEAVGGLRHLTGFPDEPPVRSNLSLGDTLAGLHAALGILLALLARQGSQGGQVVDVAIYEAVFNCLEAVVPEYEGAGVVRGPSGATITGIVPSNLYPCADGRQVVIGANNEANFTRLMAAIGRPDLAADPRLRTNAGRVAHQPEVDGAIAAWTRGRTAAEVIAALDRATVPVGGIYTVADMAADPHFQARGMFEPVPGTAAGTVAGEGEATSGSLRLPAILPKLSATPGATTWAGPALGAHNDEVWGGWLGLAPNELAELAARGVI
jgi:crotonobetainyl-CoA:carnitine CoA-transferase CaiB-like acyl-CoA transferase